jgi:hypothetical protein
MSASIHRLAFISHSNRHFTSINEFAGDELCGGLSNGSDYHHDPDDRADLAFAVIGWILVRHRHGAGWGD